MENEHEHESEHEHKQKKHHTNTHHKNNNNVSTLRYKTAQHVSGAASLQHHNDGAAIVGAFSARQPHECGGALCGAQRCTRRSAATKAKHYNETQT